MIFVTFFCCLLSFFSCSALKCVLINNQECKVRPEIINISSNEPSFYPYIVKIGKCSVVAIISMIHMQNSVFLILLETCMLKYLI